MIAAEDLAVRSGPFSLAGISFEIPAGQCGVLMGKTGAGKTTLLEAICGLRRIEAGRILLGGRDATRLRPADRGIGFVPQEGALFSTMTVREHLAFGPRVCGWGKAERDARADELAANLGIAALLDRKPDGLSGGERQRVAIGRALATRPGVLCFDEPLSALDADTRAEIAALIRRVLGETGATALIITHSREDAASFADRLFVLGGGALAEEELLKISKPSVDASPVPSKMPK
ncbi:MAG: ATP-binding cassette domain-containing protein [Verrucomicrobiales bacterium]